MDKSSYIVVGASNGIGKEIAALILDKGGQVFGLDTCPASSDLQQFEHYEHFVCDVQDLSRLAHIRAQIMRKENNLAGLVNSASVRRYGPLAQTQVPDWETVLGTNVIGLANIINTFLPALRAHGEASVVNLSSCHALVARTGLGIYDATKAAQLSIINTYAIEEAVNNIRFNSVCPGPILTDYHIERLGREGLDLQEINNARNNKTLFRRWGKPKEVASLVCWLLGSESTYMTGERIFIDGGLQRVAGG